MQLPRTNNHRSEDFKSLLRDHTGNKKARSVGLVSGLQISQIRLQRFSEIVSKKKN